MTGTRIVDSHTGGEPTRLVVDGGPAVQGETMAARLDSFRRDHDHWRRALINEPRGADVLVGGLLCEPEHPDSRCGVIFFNNVGYLGMCGHGTIGLVATLAWLGRIGTGAHRIDTPVGTVVATLHADGSVEVANVAAFRHATRVALALPGRGVVHGDIAWGGNWFFLCDDHGLALEAGNVAALTALAESIRAALDAQRITGADGAPIDHVELTGAAKDPRHDARNFVLCPGLAWDRSPCGTGTSAKLACLAADGVLAPGAIWHQESVIGSVFGARYLPAPADARPGAILPFVRGRAHVTMDARPVFDAQDPYAWGIRGLG
ncbi:MAG: proline racemase family protein [Lautropia sp.]